MKHLKTFAALCCVAAAFAACDPQNGHEYVDLGLPSGTKWATCNVGATKPEEYGNYYQWGEIEPNGGTAQDAYWKYYQWAIGRTEGMNNIFEALTKYNTDANYGTVDNKTELELADDAARANWGGTWRMPTDDEWTELRENCEWTWAVGCYQDKNNKKKTLGQIRKNLLWTI